MDLDLGLNTKEDDYPEIYYEKEQRLYTGNSEHDIKHGAMIAGTDEELLNLDRTALCYGNMQAEDYFIQYKDEIKKWLKVKPEYDCYEYSKDNLCVIHMRCTDYMNSPELFLKKKYWLDGIKNMRKIRPDMEFVIVTNDTKEANKILPGIPAMCNDLAKDYSIIKNAKYLLLANSSFTYFPALTSETVKVAIAPKYWARHNVSDGYWASEQNIYEVFTYQDRSGKLFTPEECRKELEEYKRTSKKYKRLDSPLEGKELVLVKARALMIKKTFDCMKYYRAAKRKMLKVIRHGV